MPTRIQLRRTKGWRKPEGAVVVARPTKWGNPYRWVDYPRSVPPLEGDEPVLLAKSDRQTFAISDFEGLVRFGVGAVSYPSIDEIEDELRGKDLACWCPLDQPCHADVLLELANGDA